MSEFGTYSLFNFDQSEELKITGKRFPNQGLLRSISSTSSPLNGFSFLADDTLFCWVQLQEVQEGMASMNQGPGLSDHHPWKQPTGPGALPKKSPLL